MDEENEYRKAGQEWRETDNPAHLLAIQQAKQRLASGKETPEEEAFLHSHIAHLTAQGISEARDIRRAEPAPNLAQEQGDYEGVVDDMAEKAGVLKKGKVTVRDMATGKKVPNTKPKGKVTVTDVGTGKEVRDAPE